MKNSDKLQILAMYLPQFHIIPENNEWWGENFTEWTNVKKSRPLYQGHVQPQIPFENNFYDLSDKMVMQRQMELAKKYGIDGFCIYHYWFKGKKLLEKPLEDLLSRKQTQLPFCICWANEAWSRRWDGSNNAEEILMPQEYGQQSDWIQHFGYLCHFFKHESYIKINDRPLLVIYNPIQIIQRKEMLHVWNSLAIQEGFPGIYIINIRRMLIKKEVPFIGDEIADFEPHATLNCLTDFEREQISSVYRGNRRDNKKKKYSVLDYEKYCEIMVNRSISPNEKHNLGFFVGWDNTPRRGIKTELIFENNTPEAVEKYFRIQYQRSLALNNRFLFINAWNEWGEGTCIEPSARYGKEYLEAIKRVRDGL